MAASASPAVVHIELADALDASRVARAHAEHELRRSVVARSRAADALERTAGRPGVDEDERARLRAEYAAADRIVSERRAAVDRAREFERAATVVADAFESDATSSNVLALALLELAGSARRGATRGRAALASARRAAPAVRLRGTRPRSA